MPHVTILDGGFSTQLGKYATEPFDNSPLWTAKFLKKDPEICALVHRDYVKAGANIISTGSYQATVEGFKKYLEISEQEAVELIKNSVELARKGIQLAEKDTGLSYADVLVAGSVGPYGAFLHDGSEYTGSYCSWMTEEQLMTWHQPRVAALIEAGADILAFETLPCLKEAKALIRLLKQFPGTKAWISFSMKDKDSISSGENFSECALHCWKTSNQLIAVGANCFPLPLVSEIFKPFMMQHPEIPTISYPNNGDSYNESTHTFESLNIEIDGYIDDWFDIGINYVGGCCRTDSKTIKKIVLHTKSWKK